MDSYGKMGHVYCGQKMKEESGATGGQKPLLLEYNLSFEKSFSSIPYTSGLRLEWVFPPWGVSPPAWQDGEGQLQKWQWCNTQSSQ